MSVQRHIPMSSPDLTDAEIAAVVQVLQTPFLSIGPQIAAFEQAVAAYVGVRHAVAVNSAPAGYTCASSLLALRKGIWSSRPLSLSSPRRTASSTNALSLCSWTWIRTPGTWIRHWSLRLSKH